MHGGSAGNYNAFSDLWIWDGATASWQAAPAPPVATARAWHGFVYDSDRNRVVLFGGANSSGHPQETWELDPTTWIWADRTPAGAKPSARERIGMAYDAVRKRVVMYGAAPGDAGAVWEWDGSAGTWARRTVDGGSPMQPNGTLAVFDTDRQSTLLFGGLVSSVANNDLWSWDGVNSAWNKLNGVGAPPQRFEYAATFDTTRKRLIVFGGNSDIMNTIFFQDIWEW